MKKVLLAASVADGREFDEEMDLRVDLIVPVGASDALRGLTSPLIMRTPAYVAHPDPDIEFQAKICDRG